MASSCLRTVSSPYSSPGLPCDTSMGCGNADAELCPGQPLPFRGARSPAQVMKVLVSITAALGGSPGLFYSLSPLTC